MDQVNTNLGESNKRDLKTFLQGLNENSSTPNSANIPVVTPAKSLTQSSSTITTNAKVDKPVKKSKPLPIAETPHVLVWVCAAGKGGRKKSWGNSLKIVGVYATKKQAESKKEELMKIHMCGGHGDIIVGDTWEDEIDLVVKPAGEFSV